MPVNKLDNFIKNTEGRILYVSPSDLDSTDSISNQGNSLAQPFKTLQRALLESARFSYQLGNNNDLVEKTTILLMPGEHVVDNRPGFAIKDDSGAKTVSPSGTITLALTTLTLDLNSNFDLTQENNILYKFTCFCIYDIPFQMAFPFVFSLYQKFIRYNYLVILKNIL